MKHLIGIIMSAMYYNAQMALDYLEANGLTSSVVLEMIKLKKEFKHDYERKFFIVGLSEMLKCQNLPESLKPLLVNLLNNIVEMMITLNNKIQKELLQKASGEIKEHDDDDSDDEDSNYDPESDGDIDVGNSDEEDELHDDALGFVSKKEGAEEDMEEETKDQPAASSKKGTHDNDEKVFGSDDEELDNLVSFLACFYAVIVLVRLGHHDGQPLDRHQESRPQRQLLRVVALVG